MSPYNHTTFTAFLPFSFPRPPSLFFFSQCTVFVFPFSFHHHSVDLQPISSLPPSILPVLRDGNQTHVHGYPTVPDPVKAGNHRIDRVWVKSAKSLMGMG
ncbi:unnamed protein product [Linum trigynum]|uniref:Uncharacterized protein n=1 Tax=Linum trigynum TaxID=586398 RepID=A0AAV2EE26_9ROSI